MGETAFFDANACLGRSACRTPGAPYDVAGLAAELDHCRISRALVYHAAARELDPAAGNGLLLQETAGQARLVPAAVISPGPYTKELDPAAEVEKLIESGVRAFRIFPLYHQLSFSHSGLRRAFELLQQHGRPLFIDYDQPYYNFKQLGQHEQRAVDLEAVGRLAADFPGLPVVVVGANYNHASALFRLFDQRPELRVETSLFQGFGMMAYVCRRWGAERLLFGTGLPAVSPGAARAMVMYAEIEEEDRRRVAAGNLEALLGEPATGTLAEDPGRSPLACDLDLGRPLEKAVVLDVHGHIAPQGFEGVIGLTLGPQDADSIVRAMDLLGFSSLAVSSWEICGGDAPGGNRVAWEAAEQYPGRLLPYAVVNPNYPGEWPAQQEECFGKRRFFGLKPYPFYQRRPLSDPAFAEPLALADRLRLPVLCHPGFDPLAGATPEEIDELAQRFPQAFFIIAHSGGSFRLADSFLEPARRHGNVLLEINYTSVPFGMIAYLADKAGPEKILFGTDMPMRDPAPILGWVVYDHLGDEALRMILGGNLLRLIEKTGYPYRPPGPVHGRQGA
ncbi:MAG: amidohydrolase family protein [Candidatus Glassbacteria bacterium]|nr:amidohydrolase family protein [Candidatus Glassbacteria bacterium]